MYPELEQTIAELTAPGQYFELTDSLINGQSTRVWANASPSLRHLWLASAQFGNADYLVYNDERINYAQAHAQVASAAQWLLKKGITKGDSVAIAMRNYPEWMLAYWAAICIGAVPVGINAWWVADELHYGLSDCDAKLLICDEERLQRFLEIDSECSSMPVVTVRVDNPPNNASVWHELVSQTDATIPDVDIQPDDAACIFYTSGTTGRPKGATLSHRGFCNNTMSQMFSPVSMKAAQARVLQSAPTPSGNQAAAIATTPLFHVTASSVAICLTVGGGKLIHMYKWDATKALQIIEAEGVTSVSGVPTMAREILTHPNFADYDTSSVENYGGGGAPVPADLVEKISASGGGALPGQGYGMTETSSMVCGISGIYQVDKPTCAGKLLPVYDIKCIAEDGTTLPSGDVGEICVKGVQVFKGYINRPEATQEAIVDGWLHTGDIGFVDSDNFVYLVDRAKDMVLRGGENVYSAEVEMVLYQYDGVAECAVFAVADERLGEEVGVAIYMPASKPRDVEAIRAFCKTKLAGFKVPRYIWLVDAPLPRNASSKFVKKELQQLLKIEDAL